MTSKASQELLKRLRPGKAKREKECGDVTAGKEESVTAPSTQRDDVTNQQCHTFPRQESKDEPMLQCTLLCDLPKVEYVDTSMQSAASSDPEIRGALLAAAVANQSSRVASAEGRQACLERLKIKEVPKVECQVRI